MACTAVAPHVGMFFYLCGKTCSHNVLQLKSKMINIVKSNHTIISMYHLLKLVFDNFGNKYCVIYAKTSEMHFHL